MEFLYFTAMTLCSTDMKRPTQSDILDAERASAKQQKCEAFKEEFATDVICTEGGWAKLIRLECVKLKK